ncbi:MAG: 2Fe-2S iron-sulfur cluster-binding protein, partial [Bryobacteraceae bacterium]
MGSTLFDRADDLGIRVPTSCNRQGACHECIVDVTRGMDALVPRTAAEAFLRENYRLACQATIIDTAADIEFAPLARRPKILTTSVVSDPDLDPVVTRVDGRVLYD